MTVRESLFRNVLGRLAGGVAVVTTRTDDGAARGMTATSVCSVSLSPPLVLACLARTSETHEAVAEVGHFALNFLAEGDEALARHFAGTAPDKYGGIEAEEAATGAPILPGALAWCDCAVVDSRLAGDHTVYIGRVEAAGVGEGDRRAPLVYYHGRYGGLLMRDGEDPSGPEDAAPDAPDAPVADAPDAPDGPARGSSP